MNKPVSVPMRYSSSVRIGNWYEELYKKEADTEKYIEMDENEKNHLPTKQNIFKFYMKNIELSKPSKSIHFGDIVQLTASEMRINPKYDYLPVLSVMITEDMILEPKPINNECELCVAPSMKPCIRNCFQILSADGRDRTGEVLRYDQKFMLSLISKDNEDDNPLLLYCPTNSANLTNNSFSSFKNYLYHPLGLINRNRIGRLHSVPTWHCFWKCINSKPILRFETWGEPIPSDEQIVITHLATNQNLAAEKYMINTAFGQACLASVRTYKDSHRIDQWQNMWKFVLKKSCENDENDKSK